MYTSQSAALAALEILVHLGRGTILLSYVLIPCASDGELVTRLDPKRLPKNWNAYPAPPELQLIGDEWIRAGASAVLEVPSAVISTESNYVLNPRHPDFHAIRIMDPQRFTFDLRLLGA